MNASPEVWLRGNKLPGLIPELQPVADALLQAREEINEMLDGFSSTLLWEKLSGVAAAGFHLKHIAGVLDRLLTYAEGDLLTEAQLQYLKNEPVDQGNTLSDLLGYLHNAVDKSIERLTRFSKEEITQFRGVGRKQLPSTLIGLCFHAAEHTMRHTGQLLVTVKLLKSRGSA